jgi:hypothetical protein
MEEPVSAASRTAPALEACELVGSVFKRRAARHEAGGDLGREWATGGRSSTVVDVRTLQSLRIVVPPPPIPRTPATNIPRHAVPIGEDARVAAPLPTCDELLCGPWPHSAGSESLARMPMIVRLAVRARLVSPRRAVPPAGRR